MAPAAGPHFALRSSHFALQSRPTSRPALDPRIDRILSRLEKRRVHDVRARIRWELQYVLQDEDEIQRKFGRLWFKMTRPVARFKIRFDRKVVGTRSEKLDEEHTFDGVWYTELRSETRTLTRRQIRKPDDPLDPYKLGEGPFPLPFGQKKADILREFDVKLIDEPADRKAGLDHLRLTPRPGTRLADEYAWIDFWIARGGPDADLPVRVRAAKLDPTGEVNSLITVHFSDIEINTGFSTSVFAVRKPPGYDEIVEPLEPQPKAGP